MASQTNSPVAFDFEDQPTIDHLNKQQEIFAALRDKASSEENSTSRAISSQLVLITTVLITANVATAALTTLTLPQKVLALIAFLAECVAIVAGIVQNQVTGRAYGKWADAYHSVAEAIGGDSYSTDVELDKMIADKQSGLRIRASRIALYVQIACIILCLLVYTLLLSAIFFNFDLMGRTLRFLGMLFELLGNILFFL